VGLDVEMVVLDVLGTMVDQRTGIARGLRRLRPDLDGPTLEALTSRWLEEVGAAQRAVAEGRRPYADSVLLDLAAARRPSAALAASAQLPDAWPDAAAALDRLAARVPVVALSSASRDALTRVNAHAGLRWHQVLSTQDAGTVKPHPDAYRLAVTAARRAPGRLLMVAAHAWDLRGAAALGLRTAYVERPVGEPPGPTDAFDLRLRSLDELADALAG
jgi:2-haloacid dehalogenase